MLFLCNGNGLVLSECFTTMAAMTLLPVCRLGFVVGPFIDLAGTSLHTVTVFCYQQCVATSIILLAGISCRIFPDWVGVGERKE